MRHVCLLFGCVFIFGCTDKQAVSANTSAPNPPVAAVAEPLPAAPPTDFSRLRVVVDGQPREMGKGAYLLAFLSSSCDSCAGHVGELNALAAAPGVPEVVGLMLGDEETMNDLKERTSPQFPLALIDPDLFFKCIGQVPPRFIHIADNKQVRVWDDRPPTSQELQSRR